MTTILLSLVQQWIFIFIGDFARYLVGAGAVALLIAAARLEPRRIQPRRPAAADRLRELRLSLQTVVLFSLNGLGVLVLARGGLITIEPRLPALAAGVAEFVAIVVAHDAWFYWTHRALHSRRLFRVAHLAHHRSRTPTPWAAYAFAPAEAAIRARPFGP
jgi:sterol desaturase/sphingolipid hydroxylase (fatty acid hydroxylase superfamily)